MKGSRHTHSRSGLFLIELMIAILFFALASAICMQLFTEAHLVAKDSRDLSRAVAAAQSVAEYFKSTGAPQARDIYFTRDWEQTGAEQGVYHLRVDVTQEGTLAAAHIAVADVQTADKPIYTVSVKKHIPLRVR